MYFVDIVSYQCSYYVTFDLEAAMSVVFFFNFCVRLSPLKRSQKKTPSVSGSERSQFVVRLINTQIYGLRTVILWVLNTLMHFKKLKLDSIPEV